MGLNWVWCGICAKYLAFGTYPTSIVGALIVIPLQCFLSPVIKITIPNVIYIQCTKRTLSVFIFNGNIHSSNPLPMVGIELFTHTNTK